MLLPDLSLVRELDRSIEGTAFRTEGLTLRTPFLGEHQVKNAVTALKVLQVLKERGWPVTEEAVKRGFENAFIPARMEVISREP